MRTAAILPVKRLHRAKSRLGVSVADPLRGDLARAMVGDVLVALAVTSSIERTIVVTSEESVAAAADYLGALVVQDIAESTQSAAVALGIASALTEGYERVLCIPGDCPALDPVEIDALLDGAQPDNPLPDDTSPDNTSPDGIAGQSRDGTAGQNTINNDSEVTIIPDRHETGTNGLLLSPPDAIAPSFGPDSCERHVSLARQCGADWRIERLPSLLLDIDTGADLAVLREMLAEERMRAPRTRAVLGLVEDLCPACASAA